jgi:hypothetical protein
MGLQAVMNCENVLKRLGSVLMVVLAGLCMSACGGSVTTFQSSWRSPTSEPLAMRGEPVVAVVMVQNETMRRNAEDALAGEITHYGARGIPMYTLMASSAVDNEPAARAAIERAGVKGVVVMRPMGTKTQTETHTNYYSPMYNSYWGGYYGHGWGSPWAGGYGYGGWGGGAIADYGSPNGAVPTAAPVYYGGNMGGQSVTTTTTTKILQVEVMVYSLKQNKLVWAGISETTDPEKQKKVGEFVVTLTAVTVRELGAQGLLQSK